MAPSVCTPLCGCSLLNLGWVWLAFDGQECCRRAAVWHWLLDHKKPSRVCPSHLEHFLRGGQPVVRSPTTLTLACCEEDQASHIEKLGQKRMMLRQALATVAIPNEVPGERVKPPSWTCSQVEPSADCSARHHMSTTTRDRRTTQLSPCFISSWFIS